MRRNNRLYDEPLFNDYPGDDDILNPDYDPEFWDVSKPKCYKNLKSTEKEEEWEVKKKIHTECPYTTSSIKIEYPVYCKIEKLVKKFKTEWLGYLTYSKSDKGIVVSDIIIPEQEVSWSSVKVKDTSMGIGKGVIHSHPFSGAEPSASQTDEDYVELNHPFSIIVSKDMKFSATSVLKLPCGELFRTECKVKIKYIEPENDEFIMEALGKIKEEPVWAFPPKKRRQQKKKNKHKKFPQH